MNYTIKNEKKSQREIEVTIKNEDFNKYWGVAFKIIQKEVEVDGFRKGLAPENAIVNKYGESSILQEMANQAINTTYVEILLKEKLHVISEPHIHIVKLGKDEDFIYHAHVTVFPEINVGDYKSVANKVLETNNTDILEVTDEELKTIMDELSDEVKANTPDIENIIKANFRAEKENNNKNIRRSKFLEEILKSIDEKFADAWPAEFQDRDKAQIIAVQIAKAEGLTASEEEIDAESIKIVNIIPKQDLISGKVDERRVKDYAAQTVINEKMFRSIGL